MAKLQIQISDQVNDILNKLIRKSDRALLIELAVKKAYSDKNIREMFTWADDNTKQSSAHQEPEAKPEAKPKTTKKKVKFDGEF